MSNAASFLTIGHRGASGHEPENTLRSIRRALELGANGIEIDLHLSRDGHPLVIHDPTLHRTTGVRGRVAQFTLEELRRLDAGCGEQIPTLREVLDLIAGRAWLNLELKGAGTAPVVLQEVACALESGLWQPEQIVVSSFKRRELSHLHPRRLSLPILTGLLFARPPVLLATLARRYRAHSVHLPRRFATRRLIRRAKQAGLTVLIYTVNNPEEIAWFRHWGADGVFTDYPDRALLPFSEKRIAPDGLETSLNLDAK